MLKSRNNGGQAGNRPAVKSEIPPIKSRKGGVGVVCGVQVGVGVGADADAGGGRGEKKKLVLRLEGSPCQAGEGFRAERTSARDGGLGRDRMT